MSEMAKKARAAMKEKAQGRAAPTKGSVDASGWTEPTMNTEAKVGMRPISRRAFKKGGKVEGEKAMHHAGKRPRKAAGGSSDFAAMAEAGKAAGREAAIRKLIAEGDAPVPMPRRDRSTDYLPTDRPFAPEKRGGRTGRKNGGKALTADSLINRDVKEANEERGYPHTGGYKKGGEVHEDAAMDKKLIKAEMAKHEKGCRCAKCWGGSMKKADGGATKGNYEGGTRPTGGRIARADGGSSGSYFDKIKNHPAVKSAHKEGGDTVVYLKPGHNWSGQGSFITQGTREAMKLLKGVSEGPTADEENGKNRNSGGRIARKSGGRAKGKTNIRINIIAGERHPEGMAPPMGAALSPAPVRPPMPVAPLPVGGAGLPPAGAAPAGGGLPPGLGVPPPAMGPMARKSGGRVGHRGYSSYKDMDAGAGGGLGRLEKTEIQKKKK